MVSYSPIRCVALLYLSHNTKVEQLEPREIRRNVYVFRLNVAVNYPERVQKLNRIDKLGEQRNNRFIRYCAEHLSERRPVQILHFDKGGTLGLYNFERLD